MKKKHPLTFSYVVFYLLLSEDTWRIAAGFVCAVLLGPLATQGRGLQRPAEIMVWIMILALGWSITAWPARKITSALKRAIQKAGR